MRHLYYFFLNFFSPFFKFLNKKNLKVLAYHDIIDQDLFEKQVKILKQKYNVIHLDYLYSHLFKGKKLPNNPVLVTFDDGDVSVFDKGMPILQKYNIPSCLFIISGLINTTKDYWTNTVRIIERKKGQNPEQIRKIVKDLKTMANKERVKKLEEYGSTERLQLTVGQLKELQSKDMVIANHSHTHPMFDRCDEEEIQNELDCFAKFTTDWGIGDFKIFAYPNGNFNTTSENILKERGVELAFLFDHKVNSKKIDPMRISRIRVDSDTALAEFKVKVSGLHSFITDVKAKK